MEFVNDGSAVDFRGWGVTESHYLPLSKIRNEEAVSQACVHVWGAPSGAPSQPPSWRVCRPVSPWLTLPCYASQVFITAQVQPASSQLHSTSQLSDAIELFSEPSILSSKLGKGPRYYSLSWRVGLTRIIELDMHDVSTWWHLVWARSVWMKCIWLRVYPLTT